MRHSYNINLAEEIKNHYRHISKEKMCYYLSNHHMKPMKEKEKEKENKTKRKLLKND